MQMENITLNANMFRAIQNKLFELISEYLLLNCCWTEEILVVNAIHDWWWGMLILPSPEMLEIRFEWNNSGVQKLNYSLCIAQEANFYLRSE